MKDCIPIRKFSDQQTQLMEEHFTKNPYPKRAAINHFATLFKAKYTEVSSWFSERRQIQRVRRPRHTNPKSDEAFLALEISKEKEELMELHDRECDGYRPLRPDSPDSAISAGSGQSMFPTEYEAPVYLQISPQPPLMMTNASSATILDLQKLLQQQEIMIAYLQNNLYKQFDQ